MKKSLRRLIACALAMVMLLTGTTVAFAETMDAYEEETFSFSVGGDAEINETLPSTAMITSKVVDQVTGSGTVSITIPSGKTATSIYVVGNKDGGGANTTISFLGSGISVYGKTVKIDGSYHKISASSMSISSTIVLSFTIADSSQAYNLAFVVY